MLVVVGKMVEPSERDPDVSRLYFYQCMLTCFIKLLTGSKPRPDKTLSVVAGTLPLLRCRSHMISRRLNWGNIWEI